MSENAYVTAWIPASEGAEDRPRLGLISHLDTTEQAPGFGVKPHVMTYEGGDLVCAMVDGKAVSISPALLPALNDLVGEELVCTDGTTLLGADDKAGGDLVCAMVDGKAVSISPALLPALNDLVGEELVCTDGTTLLGADDKAGIAEIMALVALIAENPALPHPELGICFCPDEEIGHGAELLDLDAYGCAYAYTVDGGPIGELEWEVNAAELAHRFHSLLPAVQRPEYTSGYEGFYYLEGISGTVEHATSRYIIRDHDAGKFQAKIDHLLSAVSFMNEEQGCERVTVEIKQQYRNMAEKVAQYPELITIAKEAFAETGVEPNVIPIQAAVPQHGREGGAVS